MLIMKIIKDILLMINQSKFNINLRFHSRRYGNSHHYSHSQSPDIHSGYHQNHHYSNAEYPYAYYNQSLNTPQPESYEFKKRSNKEEKIEKKSISDGSQNKNI